MTSVLDTADLRRRVQRVLDDELAAQTLVLAELGPDVEDLLHAVGDLLRGGKRLRAAFLYWGARGAGLPDSEELVRLSSAMELFQAAALIHDDVMDDSDTRRGMPAAHRALATRHAARGWSGDDERFGLAGAVLAGNLCLTWTDELYATCGLPPAALARGRAVFDRMRTQLMAGQFLDVVESARPWEGLGDEERVARAGRVIRYKSAKYTVEHPLLIGAGVGGMDPAGVEALSRYGLDVGRAFQLRDDLLGVFGDPDETGKPAGDDLREGKRTVLLAHALAGADAGGRARVERLLGRADLAVTDVEELRGIINGSGAVALLEDEIARLAGSARAALAEVPALDPLAREVLHDLVATATARSA
ncbi:polyprenyl synthetase family protein [Phycicoccus endophyticus]|uniref:Polyprenyl synthetase family protein n=1 Tax=Phycicoccus endophyticus TaxID=1690220 RepID=A0A7G9R4X3_9MICO|nr:polyprenyl synthetase family protein [Phycicoccus endophyticus]NHI18580.1 polyprenyl synthetase family protein [Phycicoccus endophyticus]QNN50648.1 polyprenyl synthetase family protein [Phycicoccus endophyticus]GGL22689.1 geranylgeranyl pyrophosphate synthase [Phycicoccus endophyticus]